MTTEKISFALPEISAEQFRKKMDREAFGGYDRVILTGTGQCYTAALAAIPAFHTLCGKNIRACHTLEVLDEAEKELKGSLLIILAGNEECGQEKECVEYANMNGAFTLAVTTNMVSDAAKSCRKKICVEEMDLQLSDKRAGTYGAFIQILFYLSLEIAQEKGSITKETACGYEQEIRSYIKEMNQWLVRQNADICETAKQWKHLKDFESIGLGDDHISAVFCGSEIMLEHKCLCSCENIEEWCHLNFFIRENEKVGTLIFADAANEGMMRIQEAVYVINRMKRPSVLFTDEAPDRFVSGMKIYQIPAPAYSWMAPAGMFAPGVLFVYYLAA